MLHARTIRLRGGGISLERCATVPRDRIVVAPGATGAEHSGPGAHGRGSIVPEAHGATTFWPGGTRGYYILARRHTGPELTVSGVETL
jgi:hypothetical protein